MVKNLAFFKNGPSKSVPHRIGPIQCVRTCTSCIVKPIQDDDLELEDIISVMSYDNLVHRESLWFSKYQTIQYHLGQVDLARRTLDALKPSLVVYVVAATEHSDLKYFENLASKKGLPNGRQSHLIFPIRMIGCPANADSSQFLDIRQLRDEFEPLVLGSKQSASRQIAIVPVVITKDRAESFTLDIGSLCIQILEPFSLNDYISNLEAKYTTGHLVLHLYHDLATCGARLPSQLVAFLLMYLDRPSGVTREDLVENMNWLRKSAMDLKLHIAFTGDSSDAVDFALMVLHDFIQITASDKTIIVVDLKALVQYANPIVTNIAYYGIISRAILMLHNRDDKNVMRNNLGPGQVIKVMKDDLIELSQDLAESIDTELPSRPPCKDVQTCITDAFSNMQTCGHYFRIQEARIRQNAGRVWSGDYDSDEEYFLSRRNDPSFKPWVIMTQRPYRLDRLNLFMNAIEPYLSTSADDSC